MSETRRLGRGLEALLGPIGREQAEAAGALREIQIGLIDPNPHQPRRVFDPTALDELASSIDASGLLQPVTVREVGGRYQLIAGERRFRAVQKLGWAKVPAIVRDFDDQAALSLALIENLQRDDLSAIDAARGYQRLVDEFDVTPATVARLVGKDRSTVANTLRLLKLPENVQRMVEDGKLSEGHARALLAVDDHNALVRLANEAVLNQWSVREVEARTRGDQPEQARGQMMKPAKPHRPAGAEARRVEDALRERLGTDVRITAKRRGRGMVSIAYYSNDDLSRLLEIILGQPFDG